MRKEIPLLITFIIGSALVVALFIPHWPFLELDSEFSVWFDIIAGFAFILGGGNLLKMHIDRISRKHKDRFYSGVTVVAFLVTLIIGLLKVGGNAGLRGNYIAETNRSSPYIAADISDPGGLAAMFHNPTDSVSTFIRNSLAPGTLDMINRYVEMSPEKDPVLVDSLHRALVVELNGVLLNESFFDENRFREVQLGDDARSLIQAKATLVELMDEINALLSDGRKSDDLVAGLENILTTERFAELGLTRSVKALSAQYKSDPVELVVKLKELLNEAAPGNAHIELNRLLLGAVYTAEITPSYGSTWFSVIYNSIFTPLQATMFSLLAFFVASASYRAFRAKTLEATVLLLAAFIILIGRTPLGYYFTFWLPDWLQFLHIPNLSAWILSTPNLAGQRAIMIGISLGIIATSLKLILGIERGWLGQEK